MDAGAFQDLLRRVEVLRAPAHALSTFGATRLAYHMVSPVEDLENRTRLRTGTVASRKPQILTPEALHERFQGFGRKSSEFARWLTPEYHNLLRALEYNFKNSDLRTRVVSGGICDVSERILKDLDQREARDEAVIRCPDSAWGLALMKFTLDHAARSFPVHVRDIERRGLFDPAGKAADLRRREIERLFQAAKGGRAAVELLGRTLREYGLFEEYEDRFLAFF